MLREMWGFLGITMYAVDVLRGRHAALSLHALKTCSTFWRGLQRQPPPPRWRRAADGVARFPESQLTGLDLIRGPPLERAPGAGCHASQCHSGPVGS